MTQDFKEKIAQGAFGEVYKGWAWGAQKGNRAQTAVKIALRGDGKMRQYLVSLKYLAILVT